jgi:CheY-like chemotaxis protein
LSRTQQEYVGDIFTSGQHLLSLINDILDLSKVEAGMMALELEPVDLKGLLTGSLSIVREKAADQGITVEIEAADELGLTELDMRKTKQIVYNLLSNAVKFCARGARISLRARRVPRASVGNVDGQWPVHGFPLADSGFDEFIEISVRDGGIGISMANMAKLFQAFSQIDSSLARKFEGTGLGLAMVKLLAELHGGTVAVASAEGEGACFVVWLPLRDATGRATLPHGDPAHVPAAGRADGLEITRVVLVVDDNPKSVEVIAAFLPAPQYKVVRTYGGEQAILSARQVRPDLILLDLMMPNVNGFDVVAALQGDSETASIPILILSARDVTELDREVLRLKAGRDIRIIQKAGFGRAAFINEVRHALQPHLKEAAWLGS